MAGRILFIDQLDNELMDLKLSLEAEGFQVSVQPNSKQAIDDAKVNVPNLVIIEVLTRPVGGLEFASAINLGKYGFRAPVIFYTAFYRDERARQDITEKYGALHYFVKPFQREALKRAIFSVLEESSQSRIETQPQTRIDTPKEVLPFKPVDEKEEIAHLRISEPAPPQQSLIVQPPPPEPPPLEIELTSLEPFKKEPEVEVQLKTEAPVAPARVTTLKMYPKSPKVWAKDDKPKIQTPTSPGQPNPRAPLRVDPKVSLGPKGSVTRTVLPSRPVKKMKWNWVNLALLFFVSFAVLYWAWNRFGHSSPDPGNEPSFESDGASSSDLPPSNSTKESTESTDERDPAIHDSAAEKYSKSPSAAHVQGESPPKHPLEPGTETPSQNPTLSPRPELVVSDISVSIREPQLLHMKKAVLSDEDLIEIGGETFVIRVVIDGKGKVREVTQLKKNSIGASLPQSVLDSIWQWEFKPVARREGQFFVKHYSFKVAHP